MEKVGLRTPDFQCCLHEWRGDGLIEEAKRGLIGLSFLAMEPALEADR